jgi:hypothetical protein
MMRFAYPAQLAPVMAEPQLHDLLHQLLLGPENHEGVNQGPDATAHLHNPLYSKLLMNAVL